MIEITVAQGNIAKTEADCIVVNLFDGVTVPGGATGVVDRALGGAISDVIAAGDFTGEAGSCVMLYSHGRVTAPRVLVVGLGPAEQFDLHGVRRAAATAAKAAARTKGVKQMATVVHGSGIGGLDVQAATQAVAEGTALAVYQAPQYKKDAPEQALIGCTIVEFDDGKLNAVEAGAAAGRAIAAGVLRARDFSSEPANILYPEELARRAKAMADETGLRCTILGEEEMRELGMNIFLAVSRGSEREAQLVILDHAPAGTEEQPPVILVGKGVTFDTGGISLKPSSDMWYMKDDMSGAGVVISAMGALAALQTPRRVIGVAACVENMPDGRAYRPGDILTGITGKTTEIISTDAEGRLILADTLGYVARFDPECVVDLATLTGAIGIALGPQAAGLFANDDALRDRLLAAAERSGERLWPMPLYDEYKNDIKSDMADVKNSGGRFGGVATSAKFLEHFTEGYPWAHLDIATMAWAKQEAQPETPVGATGYGVRLLVEFVKGFV